MIVFSKKSFFVFQNRTIIQHNFALFQIRSRYRGPKREKHHIQYNSSKYDQRAQYTKPQSDSAGYEQKNEFSNPLARSWHPHNGLIEIE